MTLKNATLLAIIGLSLLAALKIYTTVIFLSIMGTDDLKYLALELTAFAGIALIIPFLIVLYKKQN